MQLDGAIRVPSRMRGQAPSVRLSASANLSAFENEGPARASREAARTLCARFPASRLVCLDFSDVCAQPSRAFACGKARARTYRLRNGIFGICGDHGKTHRACAYRPRNVMARSRGRCDSSAFENVREGVVRAPERLRQFERPRECAGMRAGTRSVRSGTRAMREARCACPFGNRALQRQLLAEFCLPRHGARRFHSFRVLPYAVRSSCLPRHSARSSGKNASRQGARVGFCPRRRLACTLTGRPNAAPAELDARDMRLLARLYRMRGSSGMYVCLQPKCSILFSYRLPR